MSGLPLCCIVAGVLAGLVAASPAEAADAAPPRTHRIAASAAAAELTEGKRIFDRNCAECHAPGFGHPGTQQLGWTRGESRAVLEQRTDLTADYIAAVVRNGLVEMPAFRPSQITDRELGQLARYLSRPRRKT
jgi:mono/diheme cytochrome c family protein